MALEPCKVCGSLTSMEADTCPHCGFPPTGRKRSPLFIWTGRILAFAVILSLVLSVFSLLRAYFLSPPDPFQQQEDGRLTYSSPSTLAVVAPNSLQKTDSC